MRSWDVWETKPVSDCWAATGKAPIGGRWVDHNKGDDASPRVRSQWVANGHRTLEGWRDVRSDPSPGGGAAVAVGHAPCARPCTRARASRGNAVLACLHEWEI